MAEGKDDQPSSEKGGRSGGALRILAAAAVVGVSGCLYLRFHHLLTVASLRQNHTMIREVVAANPNLAPLCYIGTLMAVIGLTCPGATMLSFVGGILFEQPYASAYAYCGYIIGATISYLTTTFILGDFMRRRLAAKSSLFQKFEANVKRNAFLYLVAARYTMVFPFFFVNAAAALVGVPLRTFVAASSLSCIPGAVIYTTAGGALSNLLHATSADDAINPKDLIWLALAEPNVRICMATLTFALGVLAVVRHFMPAETEAEEAKKNS